MFHNDHPLLVVMSLCNLLPLSVGWTYWPTSKGGSNGMNIGTLCNLISDLTQVTRPFYSLNSNSVYMMSCIPCIVHFTTKLVLLVYFVDSEEKLGCWPCLVLPRFANHALWLQLLAISCECTCWPWVNWNHCSYFTTPLADHRVRRPLKIQLPAAIRKWVM